MNSKQMYGALLSIFFMICWHAAATTEDASWWRYVLAASAGFFAGYACRHSPKP